MKFPPPEPEGERGWAEHRVRFPRDIKLRRKGFKIEHRPKDGEAVWSKGGVVYEQLEAELEIERGHEGEDHRQGQKAEIFH